MRAALALLLFLPPLSGCDSLPRDAARTHEKVTARGALNVAIVPGTRDADPALALLRRYAQARGARLSVEAVAGEAALRRLSEGKIDAVVGDFSRQSPWKTEVALSKPLTRKEPDDGKQPVLRIARRNGENGFILATDRMIAETLR